MGNLLDIMVIAVFFICMLGVGIYAAKQIKNNTDFAIAGRSIKLPVLIGTLTGTAIGASSTVGTAGLAYKHGIVVAVIVGYSIGLALFGFVAPIIRRIGVWNIPDVLVLRYGNRMRLVFAVILVLGVIAVFGTQLIAVGLVVTSILGDVGVTYMQAVIGASIVMIFYTILGGLLAVAYTDLLQSLIMFVTVGIIMPIFVLSEVGGAAALEFITPEPGNFLGGLTPMYVISIFVVDILFCMIDPSLWQRAAAAKDARSIKIGMFATAGINLYWGLAVVFLGIAASHFFPGLIDSPKGVDAAMPRLIVEYMPVGLKGLCLAAMIAIMMSTADTCLLVAGTSFSHDLISPLKPKFKDKELLLVSRLFILAIGILGVIFALHMTGIFDMILLAFAIFVAGGFAPTIAGIFWDKATKAGAFASSIVGTVSVIVLYALKLSDMLSPWIDPIIVSVSLSVILMIGVSQLTYKPETATRRLLDMQS
ncbi:sodium:solute symporter family protein [bacterium]|nr:sodium:solute symporter family protein [bacterium]